MPELPDVETLRRYFQKNALRHKITDVHISSSKILKDVSKNKINNFLKGKSFKSVVRHGKYIVAYVARDKGILMHFGMTGYLKYLKRRPKEKHIRMNICFSNRYSLYFVCQRMLGSVSICKSIKEFIEERNMGPDALNITWKEFKNKMSQRKGNIKNVLIDQSTLAGIGNIYSDEILFKANIYPKTKIGKMDAHVLKKIYRAMKAVLRQAIKSKANPENMPHTYLVKRRKNGQRCPKCKKENIRQIKMNSRSAYYCPKCQKNG